MSVAVVPADRGREKRAFLRLPYALYRGDPAFVPPLLLERKELIDPRRNAFFAHADVALFLARTADGRRPTGRISAQLDREEERVLGVKGATFGLFEAEDADSARALLEHVCGWARERGAVRVRGPFSLSINQESGLLVDGFDVPPMVFMPHGKRAYGAWVEAAGFAKERDLWAWRVRLGSLPASFWRAGEKAQATPGLHVRPLDVRDLPRELPRVLSVFNSAWAGNWGFLPMTPGEVAALARDLRLVADPRIALLAEVDGQPVGIAIGLPNVNEAIRDLGGRLLPLGWAKLLWRLKVRGVTSARLALMGVVAEWRGARGRGLTALLLREFNDRALAAGYRDWEISWVLEDNRAANQVSAAVGAVRVKTYRVYTKALA